MEEGSNFNDIVAKPLTKQTKEDWFEWVKNYLISQDLWEVTSRSARQERECENPWRRKNAASLHVIRISCGPHNLPFIRGASEAQVAWDILYRTYGSPPPPPRPPPPPPPRPPPPWIVRWIKDIEMGILYKAISDNNWSAAKEFIDRYPIVLDVEFGASRRETPLHVAAKFGLVGIVEELVRLVAPEYLEIYDALGNTPLIIAIEQTGDIPIAQCLINKNSNTLAIPARRYKRPFPVQLAFGAGLKKMGRYIFSVTPSQLFTENRSFGASFLRTCLATGELDIVYDLLQRYKELLFAVDDFTEISTIESIAFLLPDSLDKSQLAFWKRCVYNRLGLLHRLISNINNLSGMKEICKMKQQHALAAKILNLICMNVMGLNDEKKAKTADALIAATRTDNVEFFLRVTKANPELVSLVTFPQRKRHVFFDAVRDRRTEIFNLLRGFRFKHVVTTTSPDGDNFLHAAASLAPPSYLNQISGAALQMQRELQWFKAAESMVDPAYRNVLNDRAVNPLDLFKENHKELKKDGERWMKDTASSCSVVGALIVTIMFAVAFTVQWK